MSHRQAVAEQTVHVDASPRSVWKEVTEVDIASLRHPIYLAALGVPKPVRAEVVREGTGGTRIAAFSNGLHFSQKITNWSPDERYAFTFHADPGFRVGHCLDLGTGPFRMSSGEYRIQPVQDGVKLVLASRYELRGAAGYLLRWPVRLVLRLFQAHLLRGIKTNAEQRDRRSLTQRP